MVQPTAWSLILLLVVVVLFAIGVAVAIAVAMARGSHPRDEINPNLFPCPDCGRPISIRAAACPHCGGPTVRK